jgi:hypothetical protein
MAEDVTSPSFLREESPYQVRSARILSGRGSFSPGYRLRGEGSSAPSEDYAQVNIVKVVNPLGGQMGRDNPLFTNRNPRTLSVRTVRQQRAVAASQFGTSKVIRPPRTALRRMSGAGQGVVGYA